MIMDIWRSGQSLGAPTLPDDALLAVIQLCTILFQKLELLCRRAWITDKPEITSSRTVVLLKHIVRHVDGKVPYLGLTRKILDGSGVDDREL